MSSRDAELAAAAGAVGGAHTAWLGPASARCHAGDPVPATYSLCRVVRSGIGFRRAWGGVFVRPVICFQIICFLHHLFLDHFDRGGRHVVGLSLCHVSQIVFDDNGRYAWEPGANRRVMTGCWLPPADDDGGAGSDSVAVSVFCRLCGLWHSSVAMNVLHCTALHCTRMCVLHCTVLHCAVH